MSSVCFETVFFTSVISVEILAEAHLPPVSVRILLVLLSRTDVFGFHHYKEVLYAFYDLLNFHFHKPSVALNDV